MLGVLGVMILQSLLLHLLSFSLTQKEQFQRLYSQSEQKAIRQQEQWKHNLLALFDASAQSEKQRTNAGSSFPLSAFNLYVEEMGLKLPPSVLSDFDRSPSFQYQHGYSRSISQDIPHPPQTM